MPNRLAAEPSLYLRQHADNPVDWYPWGEEAFAKSVDEDKPILLSIGYSSCHWCHVMAHESFEDPQIAAQMNADFVCVKVDREERPDVDALYMQATIGLSGSGGWPMTVFLTPAREPFFAGTYFPPEGMQGRPGFPDVLRHVRAAYDGRRADVATTADQVAQSLRSASALPPATGGLDRRTVDDALTGLALHFDAEHGGFGTAPKFPPHVALDFLVRRMWQRPDDAHAARMVEQTLTRIADGGIHDQVGGGFHRYSVDRVWLVPHFEKMLYDNALLAAVYALAHRVTSERRWREVAERTLDYLVREMRLPGGGFAAAQDADSPGGEGAFFVWTAEQLEAVLARDEAQAIVLRYGMRPEGNFEGANILHVAAPMDYVAQAVGPDAPLLVASALGKLYAARSGRPAPARDDKIVTAWNALAVQAFAEAGVAFGRSDYLSVAIATAELLLERLVVDGRLRRTFVDGSAHHLGCLDDYADLVVALVALYNATFDQRWLDEARALAERAIALFGDEQGAGFYYAGADADQLVARTRDVEDHPTPSGSAQLALGMLRLGAVTGDHELHRRAVATLAHLADAAGRYPQAFGATLTAIDLATAPTRRQVVIVRGDAGATDALVAAARQAGPHAALVVGDADQPGMPLLAGRGAATLPAAYVCTNETCSQPVTDAEALTNLLADEAG